jgi:hypothetical protein
MNKQETKFSQKLIALLSPHVYVEKTFNPLRRGTPDLYIEGTKDIAWLELKWIDKPWATPQKTICTSKSWPMQKRWLYRAMNNNKKAGVWVGVGDCSSLYQLGFGYPLEYTGQDPQSTQSMVDRLIVSLN